MYTSFQQYKFKHNQLKEDIDSWFIPNKTGGGSIILSLLDSGISSKLSSICQEDNMMVKLTVKIW